MPSGSGQTDRSTAYFRAQAAIIVRIALVVMIMIVLGILGLGYVLEGSWSLILGLIVASLGGFGLLTAVMLLNAMSQGED